MLGQVTVSGDILELITGICAEYQVDGLRADIVMYKTAATIAAYEGRESVTAADVREAAEMALLHRQRRQPFQQPHLETGQLDAMIDDFQNRPNNREPSDGSDASPDEPDGGDPDSSPPAGDGASGDNSPDDAPADAGPGDEYFEIGDPFAVRPLPVKPPDRRARPAGGRRADVVSGSPSGRYVAAAAPRGKASDLALDATLRAAAPHQPRRRAAVDDSDSRILIEPWDIREKVRETKTGSLVLFVVDASGSMGAQRRMVAVKGAILSLLLDAYQRRDRVGLIAFRGADAQLLLPPTSSVDLAHARLQAMPTGGRTPLSRGLLRALEVIQAEKRKDPNTLPLLTLLSDGRANAAAGIGSATGNGHTDPITEARQVAAAIGEQRIPSLVIDTETGYLRFALAAPIAQALGAPCLRLEELPAGNLAAAVRARLPSGGNHS